MLIMYLHLVYRFLLVEYHTIRNTPNHVLEFLHPPPNVQHTYIWWIYNSPAAPRSLDHPARQYSLLPPTQTIITINAINAANCIRQCYIPGCTPSLEYWSCVEYLPKIPTGNFFGSSTCYNLGVLFQDLPTLLQHMAGGHPIIEGDIELMFSSRIHKIRGEA